MIVKRTKMRAATSSVDMWMKMTVALHLSYLILKSLLKLVTVILMSKFLQVFYKKWKEISKSFIHLSSKQSNHIYSTMMKHHRPEILIIPLFLIHLISKIIRWSSHNMKKRKVRILFPLLILDLIIVELLCHNFQPSNNSMNKSILVRQKYIFRP